MSCQFHADAIFFDSRFAAAPFSLPPLFEDNIIDRPILLWLEPAAGIAGSYCLLRYSRR